LEAGYAVVFMHRQNSIEPYHRRYTHSHLGFLDYLEPKEDGSVKGKKERVRVIKVKLMLIVSFIHSQ
jgi:phosphopantothenate-cysteine ligase